MEKQRLRRGRKKKNRNQEQNHDAELFVLSPNILEQLGIELGQTTRKNESMSTEMEPCMNNNTAMDNMSNSPTLTKDTSLSETAMLTKNSIFLSPTFTHYAEATDNYSMSENVKNKVVAIDDAIHRNSLPTELESNTFEKEVVPSKMTNGESTRSKIHIISQEAIIPPYKLSPSVSLINSEDNKNIIDSNQKTPFISTYAPEILVDKIKLSNGMMEWQNNSSILGSDSRNDHHIQRGLESDTKFACAVQVTNVNDINQNEGNYYCNELTYLESVLNQELNQENMSEKPETSISNQVTCYQLKENLLKPSYPQEIDQREAAQSTENPVANNIIAEQLLSIPVTAIKSKENIVVNNLAAPQSKENPVNSYEFQPKEKPTLSELNEVQSKEIPILSKLNEVQKTEKTLLSELNAVQAKEELMLSELNAVKSKGKPALSELKPVQSKEKLMLSALNAVKSKGKLILSELNEIQSTENPIMSELNQIQSTEIPKLNKINAVESKKKIILSELNADPSKEKIIFSELSEIQPTETPKFNKMNAVQSKEKLLLSELNAVKPKEKLILSELNEIQSTEKPILSELNEIQHTEMPNVNKNAVQSKKTIVLSALNEIQSKEKPVLSEPNAVQSKENPKLSELNPVQSKEKPVFSELSEIQCIDKPTLSELNTVQSKEKPILSELSEIQCIDKPTLSELNTVQSKEKPILSELNAVQSKGMPLSKMYKVQSTEKPKLSEVNEVPSKRHCVLNEVQTFQSKQKLVACDNKLVNSKVEKKHEDLLPNKLEKKHEDLSNNINCRTDSRTNVDITDSETQNHNVKCDSSIKPSIFPNSKQNVVENRLCDIIVTPEDQTSSNINDSVKEIASYLSKVMKKKQLSNVKNNVIPKSSFHGVEKPGGVWELNKSTCKVYQRKKHHSLKRNEESSKQFQITYQDQLDKIRNSNHVIDCEKTVIFTTSHETFCNCSDFGNLSYDSEMICSEHVHFENKKTNIKLENIFDCDDRLSIDTVWDQVNHETYCKSSDSEDNNLPNFICFDSDQFETLETGHCDIGPEIRHELDFKTVMYENQTKRKFPKKMISNTHSDNTSFEEQSLGNEKENQGSVTSTSDALKINKDNNEKHLFKNKTKRNNSNVEIDLLTKENRHSRAEKVSTLKEDELTNVEVVKGASIVESKNVSGSNGMRNDSLNFIRKSSEKRESTVGIGNVRNKPSSDVGTRMDAILTKKRKMYPGVEKQDIANLKSRSVVGEPCLKKHKSDKIYKNRKRSYASVEESSELQFYKCDDCNELINDQTRAKHVEDHHSFIGFNENEKELTSFKKVNDPEKVSTTKKESNARKYSYSEKVRHLGKEVGNKDNVATDTAKSSVTCGVCNESVPLDEWLKHIAQVHNYLAWKKDKRPLKMDNYEAVRQYLHDLCKETGALVCCKCGKIRKYAKSFMQHIKNCTGPEDTSTLSIDASVNESILEAEDTSVSEEHLKESAQEKNTSLMSIDQSSFSTDVSVSKSTAVCDENKPVKCGVCRKEVVKSKWIDHIFTEHDYIAWKEGDKPLDINNEQSIHIHLHNTAKDIGGLTCSKCGILRKYAKKFMQHIKNCTGPEDTMDMDESVNESIVKSEDTSVSKDLKCSTQEQNINHSVFSEIDAIESTPACDENEAVQCGVCMKEVVKSKWIDHIFTEHDYIAWKEGDKPLDLNDEQSIYIHLHNTAKNIGGLTCSKCGTLRKYAKKYMQHIKNCTGPEDISSVSMNVLVTEDDVRVKLEVNEDSILELEENVNLKCGVCEEEVEKRSWWNHIFKKHQYLARLAGEPPINLEDAEEVRLHLHGISKQLNGLKCPKCGRKIKYAKNYIEHVKTCDDTGIQSEDEISLCDESQNYLRDKRSVVRERVTKNTIADNYKCGVCGKVVDASNWISHISNEHQYIAWKEGETPLNLNDDEEIRLHLHDISKQLNGLMCNKCGRRIKYTKIFMEHVNSCVEITINSEDEISLLEESQRLKESRRLKSDEAVTKCGVCGKEVVSNYWMQHIFREHQYFAWKEGDTPLQLNDEEEMRLHLHGISKQLKGLKCMKCGRKIKYAKNYMEHVKSCDASSTNSEDEISLHAESLKLRKSRSLAAETFSEEKSSDNRVYKCGRCAKEVDSCDWIPHIFKEHQYIAWKEGDNPLNLDNNEEIRLYLHGLCKQINGLECLKCWRIFRYAKVYMEHVKNCAESGQASENTSSMSEESPTKEDSARIKTEIVEGTVTCAVCKEEVDSLNWISHICAKHQYIAWKEGDKPLNLSDEDEMRLHLHHISRQNNGLICCNCDRKMKYAKNYMDHIKNCADSASNHLWRSSEFKSYFELDQTEVDCGVCDMTVKVEQWLDHIHQKHNYLAKKKGAKPLDMDNQDEVLCHLNVILKALGSLTCIDCGVVRKYSKVFLHHWKDCKMFKSFPERLAESGEKAVCAMCSQEVSLQTWKKHVMEEHYNIGWMVGQQPININSQSLVNSKLKEYKDAGHQLLCKVCGLLRISEQGFFAHIMVCGRSEAEQEVFKVVCEICNERYLYLYKYKHMKLHKDEKILQEKILKAENACEIDDNEPDTQDSGKRRAKKKAIKVIGNLSKNISGYKFKCPKCDFGSDCIEELNSHNCDENQNAFESDGDDSVKSEALSDNESAESDIDSNVSAEEEALDLSNDDDEDDGMGAVRHNGNRKKKRALPVDGDFLFPLGPKRPPMSIKDRKLFIAQSGKDYTDAYYTDDVLHPEWRKSINEILPQEEASIYFPSLEESCQISIDINKFFLKRFEAVLRPGAVLFAGGCVRRIAFAPTRLDEPKPAGNFLAILCHNGTDEPRYVDDQIEQGPGLVQIWDFNNFTTVPTFELGLCHDFGTIWACDWCPSGCRDYYQPAENDKESRLGLLAIACSNGSAYILSVPHPSTVVKDENKFLRIKPVAELRMSEPSTRKVYQATAIKWTPQNGHETIAVGYSNGYVAYYNIKQDSPLLCHKENGVDIFYPYQEERRHKSCVTDIDIGALIESTSDISTVSSASPSGSCLTAQSAGGFSARCVGINPADKAFLSKVCPHVLLAGDYSAVNKCINEIEWWGSYQRRLAIQTCAECLKCGALASYTSPVVKLLRLYPLLDHKNTKMPLKIVDLVPLGAKRKIQSDKLGLVVEPRTYEEAIKKYGVGIFRVTNKRAVSESQRSVSIDRFPLADVTSMDFCTASAHHNKLAVAIHAGFVFITHAC